MSRLTAHMSESTSRVVEILASRLESSPEEVVRDGLSMLWWLARERSTGTRILVQRGDTVTELVIPSLDKLAGGPPLEEPEADPGEEAAS